MLWMILLVFAAAAAAPALASRARRATGAVLATVPLAVSGWLLWHLPSVAAGSAAREIWPWLPALGVSLSFRLDGLSLLFALLISGIGVIVIAYAGAYTAGDERAPRLFASLLAFMGAMLGLVLADDVIVLFVFWELTSITSYLLVGFDHERPAARAAALQALLVTGGGGLALLAGLLLLATIAGTFSITAMLDRASAITAHPLYGAAFLLVALGAFTKSAQFPFHFWLPGAMVAPTPVSAYLHSATMVKAGLFLLARLAGVLGGTDLWHYTLVLAGAATMLLGAAMALFQDDLKRILAYTTLSALGTITLLLGIDTVLAVKAALVFVIVHALYKGALFLVAGAIDHEAGTRLLSALGGLRRAMPLAATASVLAALSMAGFPPLLGFIGKELLYEAKTQAPNVAWFVSPAGVAANALIVASAALVAIRPFFGAKRDTPHAPHDGPAALWTGPLVLVTCSLAFGMLPGITVEPLVAAAVSAVRAEPTEVTLELWHGINPVFVLSVATVMAGAAGLRLLMSTARAQTRWLQSGRLGHYVRITVATATLAAGWVLVTRGVLQWPRLAWPMPHEAALMVLMVGGAIVAVRVPSRFASVAALGVVGFAVAVSFLVWSGPDLALTQFAIETLSVLLFVFVVYRLPRVSMGRAHIGQWIDGLIAGAAGIVMTVLTWAVVAAPHEAPLKEYFGDASVPKGKGRNVVNVILVDFRAFDTLGEITVLAVAALGVHALIRLRPQGSR